MRKLIPILTALLGCASAYAGPPTPTLSGSGAIQFGQSGSFALSSTGSPTPTITAENTPYSFTAPSGTGSITISTTEAICTPNLYRITLTGSNTAGMTFGEFDLTVWQCPYIRLKTLQFTQGVASSQIATTISYPPAQFVADAGLPAGLSMSALGNNNAKVTGTPTAAPGLYSVPVTATNDYCSTSGTLFLQINAPPTPPYDLVLYAPNTAIEPTLANLILSATSSIYLSGRTLQDATLTAALCTASSANGVSVNVVVPIKPNSLTYGNAAALLASGATVYNAPLPSTIAYNYIISDGTLATGTYYWNSSAQQIGNYLSLTNSAANVTAAYNTFTLSTGSLTPWTASLQSHKTDEQYAAIGIAVTLLCLGSVYSFKKAFQKCKPSKAR